MYYDFEKNVAMEQVYEEEKTCIPDYAEKFRSRVTHVLNGLLQYVETVQFVQMLDLDLPGREGYLAVFNTYDEFVSRGGGSRQREELVEHGDLYDEVDRVIK